MRAAFSGALLLSLCVGAGCGSDGDSELTKPEFLARGDAICAEAQAEAAELAYRAEQIRAQIGTLPEAEAVDRTESLYADQIAVIERFHDRFADLEPPAEDEARVEEFLRSLTDGLDVSREMKAELAAGSFPSGELVMEYGRIVIRGNTLAQAYGFTVCGRSG